MTRAGLREQLDELVEIAARLTSTLEEVSAARDAFLALIEPLVGALEEAAEMFHDLSENKRLAEMEEWTRTARRWRDQGDMYGWNFYEGMRAGANATDILYQRLGRLIRDKRAALAQEQEGK